MPSQAIVAGKDAWILTVDDNGVADNIMKG